MTGAATWIVANRKNRQDFQSKQQELRLEEQKQVTIKATADISERAALSTQLWTTVQGLSLEMHTLREELSGVRKQWFEQASLLLQKEREISANAIQIAELKVHAAQLSEQYQDEILDLRTENLQLRQKQDALTAECEVLRRECQTLRDGLKSATESNLVA